VPSSIEYEYYLGPKDRWRIPILFLLIYVPICLGSLISPSTRYLSLIWSIGGIAQALLLRKYVKPIAWIAATVIGAIAALIIDTYSQGEFNPRSIYGFFRIVEFMITVGISQWLVLLRYVNNAKQWYLAGVFAAIVVFLAFIIEVNLSSSTKEVTLNWLVAGLVLGTAQAIFLRNFRKKVALPK
jgi:membrane-associated HD superfamily phosphohydrolase